MPLHVSSWQFDTDCETLHDENDSGELIGENVDTTPGDWIDQVGTQRTEDDTDYCCYRCLTNVEFFLDDRGTEHEQAGEAAENDVDEMGVGDCKLRPGHDELSVFS